MMRAKRVQLISGSTGILGMVAFRCELSDGTFWVYQGKAVPSIGFHLGANDDDNRNLTLELRWPNAGGASLGGDCAFSAFEVGVGAGLSGIVLWDFHGTVGKLTGVTFGAGLSAIPIGWGKVRQADSFMG
jgi:hypothetical protein